MAIITRDLTLQELFHKKPVIMNKPYSILPENLPLPSVAPVVQTTAPNLAENQISGPSFFTLAGRFMEKYWVPIFLGFATCYLIHKHIENNKDHNKTAIT
jgi:hypothetical protein